MMRGIRTPLHVYCAGYVLRKICAISPIVGLVPKPEGLQRKPGITAIVRVRNEPYIQLSLLSIADFADEIVIIDSSTDDTSSRIGKLIDNPQLNIQYTHEFCDLREAYQIALRKSTREWCIKWDADFIAYESRIHRLKQFVLGLPRTKYFVIEFPLLTLTRDFFHVPRKYPYHTEGWLFKFSPTVERIVERRHSFPKFYEKRFVGEVYGLHLVDVKTPARLLERTYQRRWIEEQNKSRYSNLFDEYVRACVKRDYGAEDLGSVAENLGSDLCRAKETVLYSEQIHGVYPAVVREYLKIVPSRSN